MKTNRVVVSNNDLLAVTVVAVQLVLLPSEYHLRDVVVGHRLGYAKLGHTGI